MDARMRAIAAVLAAVVWAGSCSAAPMSAHSAAPAEQPAQSVAPKPYKKDPGPFEVDVARYDWHDAVRNRLVPVKIYFPRTGDDLPVIIFSHGLGGTREGYEYLGRHWASHGYVSVHLQHKGSDNEAWQSSASPMASMRRAAADPKNAIDRPLDVRFAIDQLERMSREDSPLKGRLDVARVGVAGHSFGAYTALAAVGQAAAGPLGRGATLADPRIRAAIPMSAPVPRKSKEALDLAFGNIKVPCLHMTGTLDDSPIGDTTAEQRRLPFDHSSDAADRYLIIFKGGDHMVFSGRRLLAGRKDAAFHDYIRMSSTAFWDAYLKGDAAARSWLAEGGLAAIMGDDATLEVKLKAAGMAGR